LSPRSVVLVPEYARGAGLSIAAQAILNPKSLAYFVLVLYYLAMIALGSLGLDHPMLMYAALPNVTYSAMNGFGHYLALQRTLLVYWGGAALVLLALALVLWPRGVSDAWLERLQ